MSITAAIRRRRSIFPNTYVERDIPRALLEEILENANYAPTHKLTQPWRFRVYRGDALRSLSDFLGDAYVAQTPPEKYSEKKEEKTRQKPLQSDTVLAIVLHRHADSGLPEWEEIAAVSMAVQNMWLTASEHGIGSYWSSPGTVTRERAFFELAENERCLGLFFLGYHELPELPARRNDWRETVTWV